MQLILNNPLDFLCVLGYAAFSVYTVYHALISGEVQNDRN